MEDISFVQKDIIDSIENIKRGRKIEDLEDNELDQLLKVYKCINNSLSERLINQQEKFDSYEYKIKNNLKKIKK